MKRLLLLSMSCLALVGCDTQGALLGAGSNYLLTTYDALGPPGHPVRLQVRLQAGDFLHDQPGHVARFYVDGQLYGVALTDANGFAEVDFVPDKVGEYVFLAELAPGGFPAGPPQPQRFVVVCRATDTPLLVVDMDKTLVESGFLEVLLGDPSPMPDSPRVMRRLAEKHTVVYLTHRPNLLGPKSRKWLADQGYPAGPVLLSDLGGFLAGSEEFKSSRLNELRKTYPGIQLGIGDKISDAKAYHVHGTQAYVIVMPWDFPGPASLRNLAGEIERELPPQVQVVSGWKEVEQGVFEGLMFPPARMVKMLEDRAAELERAAGIETGPPPAQEGAKP